MCFVTFLLFARSAALDFLLCELCALRDLCVDPSFSATGTRSGHARQSSRAFRAVGCLHQPVDAENAEIPEKKAIGASREDKPHRRVCDDGAPMCEVSFAAIFTRSANDRARGTASRCPMRLHRDLADAEFAADLLVQQTGDHQRHDRPISRRIGDALEHPAVRQHLLPRDRRCSVTALERAPDRAPAARRRQTVSSETRQRPLHVDWTVIGTSPWPRDEDDQHVGPFGGDTLLHIKSIEVRESNVEHQATRTRGSRARQEFLRRRECLSLPARESPATLRRNSQCPKCRRQRRIRSVLRLAWAMISRRRFNPDCYRHLYPRISSGHQRRHARRD